MKIKFLPLLVVGFFATTLFMSSCLDNDFEEVVYPAESSITSFSIGTVKIEKVVKDTLGRDTTVTDTVSCAHYPFTINQLKRTIENKDSLPVGSDVSKVLASITADTRAIIYSRRDDKGELKDTVWTETDSIDFRYPVTFKVFALNGNPGVPYTVKVNVHKQNPDTLEWSHFVSPQFASGKLNRQKTVCLGDALFTTGTKEDGTAVLETLSLNHTESGAWKVVTALPDHTNTYSFQVWEDKLYFVADGKLYRLTNGDAADYQQVGAQEDLVSLVGLGTIAKKKDGSQGTFNYQEVLFAYTANEQVVALTTDGAVVSDEPQGFVEDQAFSSLRLSSVQLPTRHNINLTRTIVIGNNASNDSISSVYAYTTRDEKWNRLLMKDGACPNLENISMIKYDNKLYAFGGGMSSQKIKPFESFYSSIDNGLTWQKVSTQMTFPQEETSKHPDVLPFAKYYTAGVEGSYSTAVDSNHFIWLVWENGNVTKGRLNRLGFAPKW